MRNFTVLDKNLNINNYKINNCVSQEAFWTVLDASNIQTGEQNTLRVLRNDFVIDNHTDEYMLRFYDAYSLNIPGIIKCIGFFLPLNGEGNENLKTIKKYKCKNKLNYPMTINMCGPIFFTELIPEKDVFSQTIEYIKSEGKKCATMNPTIRSKIIFFIAATMKQIHKHNIIHHFLDLTNVFLDKNLEPKIDGLYFPFNHILELESEIYDNIYKYISRAPDLFNDEYSFPVDVYSFGVILYILFTGDFITKLYNRKSRYRILNLKMKEKLFIWNESIPDVYWELIQQCLLNDQSKRPTFEQITEKLRDDRFAIEEFGMKTDISILHEYQKRIDYL